MLDRTGHRSSAKVNGYRRAARTAADLALEGCAGGHESHTELSNYYASAPGTIRTCDLRFRKTARSSDKQRKQLRNPRASASRRRDTALRRTLRDL